MIFRLRRMTFEMYESNFVGDETLSELALDIACASKDEQDRAMNERQLSECVSGAIRNRRRALRFRFAPLLWKADREYHESGGFGLSGSNPGAAVCL